MKRIALLAALACLFAVAGPANAFNAPVTIRYPANNATVTNNFSSKFSATCPSGRNTVRWYLNGVLTGSATFYDTADIQLARRLTPGMSHSLKVLTSCGGGNAVVFNVQ